jgi:hypothetical protein
MSGNNHAVVISFFANYAATYKHEARLTATALADIVLSTSRDSKERLPWLKCARFGDHRSERNSLRNNENVLAISGVEADYDDKRMSFEAAVRILRDANVFSLVYTSPSFTEEAPKWRILCFCSRQYPPSERDRFLARLNGLFSGIFAPESWKLSQSYYYGSIRKNPSHRVMVIDGTPIDLADHLDAIAIKPVLQEAQAAQREARSTRASDDRPRNSDNDSLIDKIRAHLDLGQVLAAHGYALRGHVYRHPNSQSGSYGLNIKAFSGIERLYSHNGGDPLHPGNLPAWTAGVTAIDVFDAVVILDFGGDRARGLRELAQRFRLTSDVPPFRRIWDAAGALNGSVGATWLETIGLEHLPACPELRFHPACPHGSGTRLPALVAAVRSLDGSLTGIQRIYLNTDGTRLADIEPQKLSLGKLMGSAIRLAPIEAVLAAGEVVIAEDIEEAASLGLLLRRPAWATGTASNMRAAAGIVLPPEVRRVVIANVGTNGAARSAYYRLKGERRAPRFATPPGEASSYVEILKNGKMGAAA